MLTLVSYGVVAANKPLSSMNIEVTPIEQVTMTDGELTDNLTSVVDKGADADGAAFETTTHTASSLTAKWLPFGSNRKTAPDVRRGEKVCIWKFADADKYYWSELEYNGKLRKLETIIIMISNTQNEDEEATVDNTYYLEFSTHGKIVHLHTSMSDGEPYGYDFLLNTKEGTFQITDTIENTIFLSSEEKRITMKNAEGSFFDLFGPDLFVNIEGNMVTHVKGNMSTIVDGDYALQVDGSTITKSPKVDFVTPQLTTSEEFAVIGNAHIGKMLALGGGMTTGGSGGGDIEMNGNLVVSGSGKFSARVEAPNID